MHEGLESARDRWARFRRDLWRFSGVAGPRMAARLARSLARLAAADGDREQQIALVYFSAELFKLDGNRNGGLEAARHGRDLALQIEDDEIVELFDQLVAELRAYP